MNRNRYAFIELLFALCIIGIATVYIGKAFWFCDNHLLLNTTDAVPIYTKAIYASECLKAGQWPSWFPNWYCGTSVSQYYPPFTYVILTLLEFFLSNTTLCLKFYIFSGFFVGGLGVWCLYRRYIGRFFGIVAAVLYIFLPYFSISFFYWGTLAQVPVIAIAPWYFISCVECLHHSKPCHWIMMITLTFLLLLSHVMHGFLIALSMFITILLLDLIRKEKITPLVMWSIGTGLSAGVLGFWWVTGVLPLENPDVPSLAADAAKNVTANLTWFFPAFQKQIETIFPDMVNQMGAYFPASIVFISIFSYYFIRKETGIKQYVLQLLYIHTIFTVIFAFGSYLPFYRFIPLANKLVPGRILTQTAIGATILSAYCFGQFIAVVMKKKMSMHAGIAVCVNIVLCIIVISGYKSDPVNTPSEYSLEKQLYGQLDDSTNSFHQGRLTWFGDNFNSIHAYLAYINKYNIISGWNIEGTSTADYLRFQNIALMNEKADYLLKNMYDMNVQTCFVNDANFPWFSNYLKSNGFQQIGQVDPIEILQRQNHSYFLEQPRDSIVIGKSSNAFLTDFPWFMKGYSDAPKDYSEEYLNQFHVLYFCEPNIKNLHEVKAFERKVRTLVSNGKKVFIEFGRTPFPSPILGVSTVGFDLQKQYCLESNNGLNGVEYYTDPYGGQISALYQLDTVMYKLRCQSSPTLAYDLIGTKKIGDMGEVTFIGGPLTQARQDTLNYYLGRREKSTDLAHRDETIGAIFDDLFAPLDMYRPLSLPEFPVQSVSWAYDGCKFSYASEQNKRIMASITYTPRWKVYVDDREIPVYRMENMLCFFLPEGSHHVSMKYTTTIWGSIGLGITIISILCILIILIFYRKLLACLYALSAKCLSYFA